MLIWNMCPKPTKKTIERSLLRLLLSALLTGNILSHYVMAGVNPAGAMAKE